MHKLCLCHNELINYSNELTTPFQICHLLQWQPPTYDTLAVSSICYGQPAIQSVSTYETLFELSVKLVKLNEKKRQLKAKSVRSKIQTLKIATTTVTSNQKKCPKKDSRKQNIFNCLNKSLDNFYISVLGLWLMPGVSLLFSWLFLRPLLNRIPKNS